MVLYQPILAIHAVAAALPSYPATTAVLLGGMVTGTAFFPRRTRTRLASPGQER